MIIGFTQRSQTVSEGDAPPKSEFFQLSIDVATERTSEREHAIVFRHLENRSTAIVQSNAIQHDPLFDVLFGNVHFDPIEERFGLEPERSSIPSVLTVIRNDFRPEDDECFTMEVCVNLTHPGVDVDIFEEAVRVNVISDENSIYIPTDAILASTLILFLYRSV